VSRIALAAVVAIALFAPGAADACSVCFSTTEENRWAFIGTTVFLSVLPLGILLGIGVWLRRTVLAMERHHDTARVPAPPRP
jgi:hypothetical protein